MKLINNYKDMFKKNTVTININIPEQVEVYRSDIIEEVQKQVREYISSDFKSMVATTLRSVILNEAKPHSKTIKESVAFWIKTMPSSELFFRDEFRKILVDTAKSMQPQIDEVIREHIKTSDCNRLYDALGSAVADKFYNYIRNSDC